MYPLSWSWQIVCLILLSFVNFLLCFSLFGYLLTHYIDPILDMLCRGRVEWQFLCNSLQFSLLRCVILNTRLLHPRLHHYFYYYAINQISIHSHQKHMSIYFSQIPTVTGHTLNPLSRILSE
jgi:hypothetical protein